MTISKVSEITKTPASTIRFYEKMQFIEPAHRLENNYRVFNDNHIMQIKICRLIFRVFINKKMRKLSLEIINAAVAGDIFNCVKKIEAYISILEVEIKKAYDVLDALHHERVFINDNKSNTFYNLQQATHLVGVTKDTIRNWERNGLLGFNFSTYQRRLYTANDINRMNIIYMLLQTGYSIMAISKYFQAVAQNSEKPLQLLINPEKEEDLFTCQDRWLKTLLVAKADGFQMLSIIKEYETH